MTAQISDTFTYRGEQYDLVALSGESLFTPPGLWHGAGDDAHFGRGNLTQDIEDAFSLDPGIE
jgi:hypothetical protein